MLSIALNLAEGSGKETNADRRRFYQIAMGSLREAQAIIDLYDPKGLKKAADVWRPRLPSLPKSPPTVSVTVLMDLSLSALISWL
ncbi:MAG: four helix bundle protein [Bdellovibrionales bacterium]